MQRGRATLSVAARAYRKQYDAGRYFLHEAPNAATSRKEQCIVDLEALPGVERVNGPNYVLMAHGTAERTTTLDTPRGTYRKGCNYHPGPGAQRDGLADELSGLSPRS